MLTFCYKKGNYKVRSFSGKSKENILKVIEAAADFWDTHDVTDYYDLTEEVKDVTIQLKRKYFRIERDIVNRISKEARNRGVSAETLINLWLQEKLNDL